MNPSLIIKTLLITAPGLQGSRANGDVYRVMQASFGPALSGLAASTASTPLKLLAASPADGCFPYTKPAAYLGAVVLLQRGNCSFASKVPLPLGGQCL